MNALTLIDMALVIDWVTYENPAQYSEGMPYVLVNGVAVVRNGVLQADVHRD